MTMTYGAAWGALVLRLVLGVDLIMHGYAALGLVGPTGISDYIVRMGFPSFTALPLAWYLIVVHVVGGALIVIGLWTRIAAVLNVPVILSALALHHWSQGFLMTGRNVDAAAGTAIAVGYELSLLVLGCLLAVALIGPGPLSMDARRRPAGRNRSVVRALLPAVAVFTAACSTVPITGRSQVLLFSDEQVVGLANEHHAKFMAEARQKGLIVSPSDADAARDLDVVNRVGRRIIDAAGLTDRYRWEITLLRDKTANASVLPNGKVVVHTGLLPITKTEAGLAAVLGHEVGHVVARHSAERLSHTMLAQTGVQVANAAVAAYDPRYQAVTAAALGLGAQFGVLLPYSRAHESEADHLGLLFMAKAGYDPAEAIALWERMESAGGARQPEWLSTHPNPETRRAQLRGWLPEAQRYYQNRALPLPTR